MRDKIATMKTAHNIYIHVPFCMSKCNYCAFFSQACENPDWGEYACGIISEIRFWAEKLGRINVPTIFFGGGTPSLMPTQIFAEIIDTIRTLFDVTTDCEITIEANPKTLTHTRLNEFISAGMNRLSVGVQSLNDKELQFLGRRHSAADALELLGAAQKHSIRLSADFIYGLPGQTVADIIKLCRQINDLGLRHCSMYELTIEPSTPFGKMQLEMPDNDKMADMYDAIAQTLHLPRYEVSNYAAPADQCRHNANIWDGAPYIGIGRGAAGRPFIDGVWYEQMGNGARCDKMSAADRAIEKIITGMRTTRGAKISDAVNMDFVKSHPDLITSHGDRIAATQKGMLILDELLIDLVR